MKDCIFCKIASKEIPSHVVYEDDHVLAFLDIHPHAKGHTVVIPKIHAETLFDMNDELLGQYLLGIKRAMERIEVVLHPAGYNVGWNQSPAAGQVVPHLHAHIMPRWTGDGGSNMHGIIDNAGDKSVEEVAGLFA